MPETRELAYNDRFVRYLIQVLSDRFDNTPEFPALPFVDRTSRIPLVYRVNQDEYTQILSAIMTGGDLAFPDISHELELIWTLPDGYEPEEDFCLDYETSDSDIITFYPQNPHTEPGVVPDGYLLSPFWVVEDVLPEFLPDWFAELVTDIIEMFTGYEDDDVLVTIGSLPLPYDLTDLLAIITDGLPRFIIEVDGAGTLEMHLLSVPLGGRLLVSVDVDFNPVDIVEGVFTEGFNLVELERDYSSTPPEFDVTHIEEIVFETSGAHVVYCTFIPVLDLDAFPIKFGGGIRKIVWCPDDEPDEPPPTECTIEILLEDNVFFETEYVPATFGEIYSETVANEAAQEAVYDDTPQSIGEDIPTGTPDALETNALCTAINRFVALYASTKLCLIQSKNFIEIMWTKLANAANNFYDAVSNLMSPVYNANLNSCFVSDAAAITALQDDGAIEELACFLYDELKSVTMSLANFDAAVADAATTLTGTAQDIACIMEFDNNQSLYINMLEAYQITLTQAGAGENEDCPCEATETYRHWTWDFANGLGDFTYWVVGGVELGTLVADGVQGVVIGGFEARVGLLLPFEFGWRMKSLRMHLEWTGVAHTVGVTMRPTPGSNTSAIALSINYIDTQTPCDSVTDVNGYREMVIDCLTASNTASQGTTKLKKIEIVFFEAEAKGGYLSADGDLCT